MPEEPFNPYETRQLDKILQGARLLEYEAKRRKPVSAALLHDHRVVFERLRELDEMVVNGRWVDPPKVVSKHLRADKAFDAYLMTLAGVADTLMLSPRDVRNEFYRELAAYVDVAGSTDGVNGLIITGLTDLLQSRTPAQQETLTQLVTIADVYGISTKTTFDAGLTGVVAVNPLASQVIYLGGFTITKALPRMMADALAGGTSPVKAYIPTFDKHASIGMNDKQAKTLCNMMGTGAHIIVDVIGVVGATGLTFGTGGAGLLALGAYAVGVESVAYGTDVFVTTACDGFIETDEERAAKLKEAFDKAAREPADHDTGANTGTDTTDTDAGDTDAGDTDPELGDYPIPDDEEATTYPDPTPEESGLRSVDVEFFLIVRQASQSLPNPADAGIPQDQTFVNRNILVYDPWVDGSISVAGGNYTSKDSLRIDPPRSDAFMVKGPENQGTGTDYAAKYVAVDRTTRDNIRFSIVWSASDDSAITFSVLQIPKLSEQVVRGKSLLAQGRSAFADLLNRQKDDD